MCSSLHGHDQSLSLHGKHTHKRFTINCTHSNLTNYAFCDKIMKPRDYKKALSSFEGYNSEKNAEIPSENHTDNEITKGFLSRDLKAKSVTFVLRFFITVSKLKKKTC